MAMKHTPGPWKAESYVCFRDGPPESGWTMKIGDDVIVDLPHGAGWPEEQVEANARLIAAAPKLLEALQLILEHVDPEDNYIAPDTNWMRDLCREAIAEATGEPV